MLTNATLLRVDAGAVDAAGETAYTAGPAIAVECFLDMIENSEKWTLGAKIKDATHVVAIDKDDWVDAGLALAAPPVVGGRLVVEDDDGVTVSGIVLVVKNFVAQGIGHWVVFLNGV